MLELQKRILDAQSALLDMQVALSEASVANGAEGEINLTPDQEALLAARRLDIEALVGQIGAMVEKLLHKIG